MEVHSAAGSKDVGGEAAAEHYAVVAAAVPAFGSILHATQFGEEFEVIVPMDSGQKYTEGEAAVVAAAAAAAATSGAEYFDQWNCLKLLGGWH